MVLSGKLTKKLVESLGAGRHGDGDGLYLVVDPSGTRRWIARVIVKGQRNKKGAPLRTALGLGGADIVTINQARERALEYRRMAKQGLNSRFNRMPFWRINLPTRRWSTFRPISFDSSVMRGRP
ncbi:putative prophage integrase [Sulfitobacter noctilucicola]|nr:Arm DNA-binding domain-containing protein [Sulfitobacter noctilucicola]KIN62207.1 putative prophage integrase [Sulfitobacter noctilucicola]